MSYKIKSYDSNHVTFVTYTIGTIKLSELNAITTGNKTDSAGATWAFTLQARDTTGGKCRITVNSPYTFDGLMSIIGSVGLGSLTNGTNFYEFFNTDGNYYLQKNPTSTREYPEFWLRRTSSTSSGITYTTMDLLAMNASNTANTYNVSVTGRSDAATLNIKYYVIPLLLLDANDEPVYLGAISIQTSNSNVQIQIGWNIRAAYSNFSQVLTVTNNNSPLEGDYSYDFTGDIIDMPTAPDETVSGVLASGFLNIYSPTASQLQSFGAALWTNLFNTKWYDLDSVANLVLNAVSDPINFIVGLFMLPVSPTTTTGNGINLGGIKVNTVTAPKVSQQFKTISFGSLNIEELYGNYLDYSHSQLSIYLPYIGVADIDVQEVNGGSVELQYIIDCFTGACVANVKCTKVTKTPWGVSYSNSTVHSYTGNVAIQLPISAGSFDTLLSGLINVGLGLGMNQPAKALQGVGDMVNGMAGDVTTRGSLSSNTGKCCYQTPYLMFTRPIEVRPKNLGAVHGYSAGAGGVLSSFSGFVECTDIKLDGVIATTTELDELRRLCNEGVYV